MHRRYAITGCAPFVRSREKRQHIAIELIDFSFRIEGEARFPSRTFSFNLFKLLYYPGMKFARTNQHYSIQKQCRTLLVFWLKIVQPILSKRCF